MSGTKQVYQDKQTDTRQSKVTFSRETILAHAQDSLLACFKRTPATEDAYMVGVRCLDDASETELTFMYPFVVTRSMSRREQVDAVVGNAHMQHMQFERPEIVGSPLVIRITPDVVQEILGGRS